MVGKTDVQNRLIGLAMDLALGISPALGQANNVGVGAMKCVDFLPYALSGDGQNAAHDWASGFVSGINLATAIHTGQIYDVSSFGFAGAVRAMVDYCNAHPDQPVIASVDRMLAGLPKIASPF